MGMLLLPSQWNLTINKESQLYWSGDNPISLGLVYILRISNNVIEMVSKARPKRLSCICNAQGEEKEFRFLFKIDYDGDIRNESQSSKLIYFMNSVLE
jgi:hypothetical protein